MQAISWRLSRDGRHAGFESRCCCACLDGRAFMPASCRLITPHNMQHTKRRRIGHTTVAAVVVLRKCQTEHLKVRGLHRCTSLACNSVQPLRKFTSHMCANPSSRDCLCCHLGVSVCAFGPNSNDVHRTLLALPEQQLPCRELVSLLSQASIIDDDGHLWPLKCVTSMCAHGQRCLLPLKLGAIQVPDRILDFSRAATVAALSAVPMCYVIDRQDCGNLVQSCDQLFAAFAVL